MDIRNTSKVVILVGIPGSGKSTWIKKFCEMYPQDKYVVVNQDLLGSRDACINSMHNLLEKGENVIIDRCNVTEEQRSHWIEVAMYHGVQTITGIVLEVDDEEAIARIELRKNHPTIKENIPLEKKREIVAKFFRSFEIPRLSEGFSSVIFTRN